MRQAATVASSESQNFMKSKALKFRDRADAGQQLGEILAEMELKPPLIFALPRGGVPVAIEIARTLAAPVDL